MVSTSDPVSDMVTRIRNGYMAKNAVVSLPSSKLKVSLARVLHDSGYLESVENKEQELVLKLKYSGKVPAITEIKMVSKPSCRVYAPADKLPRVLGGMGVAVISTPKGLMTNKKAHKENLGGEVICQVW